MSPARQTKHLISVTQTVSLTNFLKVCCGSVEGDQKKKKKTRIAAEYIKFPQGRYRSPSYQSEKLSSSVSVTCSSSRPLTATPYTPHPTYPPLPKLGVLTPSSANRSLIISLTLTCLTFPPLPPDITPGPGLMLCIPPQHQRGLVIPNYVVFTSK